jgi:hypothetical protein
MDGLGHSSQVPMLNLWTNTTTKTIARDAKAAAKSQQQITNPILVRTTNHARCAAETETDDEYRTKRHSCR